MLRQYCNLNGNISTLYFISDLFFCHGNNLTQKRFCSSVILQKIIYFQPISINSSSEIIQRTVSTSILLNLINNHLPLFSLRFPLFVTLLYTKTLSFQPESFYNIGIQGIKPVNSRQFHNTVKEDHYAPDYLSY